MVYGLWLLEVWSLGLGVWSLGLGVWSLEFGVGDYRYHLLRRSILWVERGLRLQIQFDQGELPLHKS